MIFHYPGCVWSVSDICKTLVPLSIGSVTILDKNDKRVSFIFGLSFVCPNIVKSDKMSPMCVLQSESTNPSRLSPKEVRIVMALENQ
jgi:hypothetical protein